MKTRTGIALTSGVTRDGVLIRAINVVADLETDYLRYKETGVLGTPVLIGHDFSKFIGWTEYTHILFSDKAYLYNKVFFYEKENDEKSLNYKMRQFRVGIFNKYKHYPIIEEKINNHQIKITDARLQLVNKSLPSFYMKDIIKKIFSELPLDDNNMVDYEYLINNFNTHNDGTFHHKESKFVIFADKHFRKSSQYENLSNLDFFKNLRKFYEKNKSNSKILIRIDTDVFSYSEKIYYSTEFEYSWGVPFSKDISKLQTGMTVYATLENDGARIFEDITRTEFYWYGRFQKEKIKTLEIEEIKDRKILLDEERDFYVFKYMHAQAGQDDNTINHFDGSVKIYNQEQYNIRATQGLAETDKSIDYIKLFRIDGSISIEEWKELTSNYFLNNHLIKEYFEGKTAKDKYEALIQENNKSRSENYEKDVNLSISYGEQFLYDNRGTYWQTAISKEQLDEFFNNIRMMLIYHGANLNDKIKIGLTLISDDYIYTLEFFGKYKKVIDVIIKSKNYIDVNKLPTEYIVKIFNLISESQNDK